MSFWPDSPLSQRRRASNYAIFSWESTSKMAFNVPPQTSGVVEVEVILPTGAHTPSKIDWEDQTDCASMTVLTQQCADLSHRIFLPHFLTVSDICPDPPGGVGNGYKCPRGGTSAWFFWRCNNCMDCALTCDSRTCAHMCFGVSCQENAQARSTS